MKKLLLSALTIFTCHTAVFAQHNLIVQQDKAHPSVIRQGFAGAPQAKAVTTLIYDTLDYFFHKHYFRNATTPASAPPNLQFTTLKSPYPSNTLDIGHCGALFLNNAPVSVHGLTGLVIKNPGSVSASVPVKLYLCNVTLANLPIMPPLDSVITSVSSQTAGVWAGGSFTAPVNVTGNFAVLFKCASTVAGDTVRLFLNNAFTSTATAVPAAQRYGEGFGIIRFNGNYQKTTDAFGGASGNDYEFVVAPYVSFNITAAAAPLTASVCNYSNGTFTNQSAPQSIIEGRQFNFNRFATYWAPTNGLVQQTDSIYGWTFTGSSTPPTTLKNPTAFFNTLGTQSANLTVRYRQASRPFATTSLTDQGSATIDVNNGAAPVITVTGPVDFCSNSPVTTTLFCTGSTSYTWSAPINTVSPLVVITQTAASAVYTVMAQSAGCTAVKEVTVSINPLPSVSVTASKPTVCTNATGGTAVALTGSPAGGVYSGPNVSGSNFTPGSAAGTFTAVYSYTNTSTGCSNTANTSIIVANCTGFSSPTANASLMVFPNPSLHGKLKLSHLYGTNTIEVINVLGQVVLKAQSNQEEVELDLSHQANGNYFIKVSASDGSVKTVKIVNQN